MTATYGEAGLSYDAITFSYDGTELNLGPYFPTLFFDSPRNFPVALTGRNFPIPLAATDTLAARRTTTGQNPAYTSTGGLMTYTATGVIED